MRTILQFYLLIQLFALTTAETGTYQITKSAKGGPYVLDTRNGDLFELKGLFDKKVHKVIKSDLEAFEPGTYQMSYSEEDLLFESYFTSSDYYLINTSSAKIYKLHIKKKKWIPIDKTDEYSE
tara:strand:- start:38 stop:406 length:369 start_codon:yes stop_codon:yes gene_type:complete